MASEGELIKVCSANPRPMVQNDHSKGHEHWRKDPWHISAVGSDKTWCGRDRSDWLNIGRFEDHDISDSHLCSVCKRKAGAA